MKHIQNNEKFESNDPLRLRGASSITVSERRWNAALSINHKQSATLNTLLANAVWKL